MENDAKLNAKKKRALKTASLGANPRSLTAISSADGTKVLKNLDNLVKNLEKSLTQPRTFIGSMADALGVDLKGKSNKYATFECKNGNVVTIRVSDNSNVIDTFLVDSLTFELYYYTNVWQKHHHDLGTSFGI